MRRITQLLAPSLSLFTSAGTLICCALPALLVSLGAGATLAGLVSAVPELIWLSRHKLWVFGIAGLLLLAAGWLQWRSRFAPCPVDPVAAKACARLRRSSLWIYGAALAFYGVGAFFAFAAPYLFF